MHVLDCFGIHIKEEHHKGTLKDLEMVADKDVSFKLWQLIVALIAIFISVSTTAISGTYVLIKFSLDSIEKKYDVYIAQQKEMNTKMDYRITLNEDKLDHHKEEPAHKVAEEKFRVLNSRFESLQKDLVKVDVKLDQLLRREWEKK